MSTTTQHPYFSLDSDNCTSVELTGFGNGSVHANNAQIAISIFGVIGAAMGGFALHNMWRNMRRYDDKCATKQNLYMQWKEGPKRDFILFPYFSAVMIHQIVFMCPTWYSADQKHDEMLIPWSGYCVMRAINQGAKFGMLGHEMLITVVSIPICGGPLKHGRQHAALYVIFAGALLVWFSFMGLCFETWSSFLNGVNFCDSPTPQYIAAYEAANNKNNLHELIYLGINIGLLVIAILTAFWIFGLHVWFWMSEKGYLGARFKIEDRSGSFRISRDETGWPLLPYIMVFIVFIIPAIFVLFPEYSKNDLNLAIVESVRAARGCFIYTAYYLGSNDPTPSDKRKNESDNVRAGAKIARRLCFCCYRKGNSKSKETMITDNMNPVFEYKNTNMKISKADNPYTKDDHRYIEVESKT
eukprot:m.28735 g.28735  ORF g.28735 m.28735 type:complete len:413 (-) comp15969_c0_seq1:94-1332(-)